MNHTARRKTRIKMARAVLNMQSLRAEMSKYDTRSLQKSAAAGSERKQLIRYVALVHQYGQEKRAFLSSMMGLDGRFTAGMNKKATGLNDLTSPGYSERNGPTIPPNANSLAGKSTGNAVPGAMGGGASKLGAGAGIAGSAAAVSGNPYAAASNAGANAGAAAPQKPPAPPAPTPAQPPAASMSLNAPTNMPMSLNAPTNSRPPAPSQAQQHTQTMQARPPAPAASAPAAPQRSPKRQQNRDFIHQLQRSPQRQQNRDFIRQLQSSNDPTAQAMVAKMKQTYAGGQGDMQQLNKQMEYARRYMAGNSQYGVPPSLAQSQEPEPASPSDQQGPNISPEGRQASQEIDTLQASGEARLAREAATEAQLQKVQQSMSTEADPNPYTQYSGMTDQRSQQMSDRTDSAAELGRRAATTGHSPARGVVQRGGTANVVGNPTDSPLLNKKTDSAIAARKQRSTDTASRNKRINEERAAGTYVPSGPQPGYGMGEKERNVAIDSAGGNSELFNRKKQERLAAKKQRLASRRG